MNRSKYPYAALLPKIKEDAYAYGYCVGVLHGSMAHDLDLVFVPWTEACSSPEVLMLVVKEAVGGVESPMYPMERKPWGRLAYSLYLSKEDAATGTGPYLDLNIVPH